MASRKQFAISYGVIIRTSHFFFIATCMKKKEKTKDKSKLINFRIYNKVRI